MSRREYHEVKGIWKLWEGQLDLGIIGSQHLILTL